jgi:Tfp pilus assembly protein PilV
MFRSPCNNRGFTLVEAVIAIFITTVAVMAIFSLVAPAWRTTSRSDNLGRAANILNDQLQRQESLIMNPCNAVTTGTTGPVTVYSSGSATGQSGDTQFNVTRTITNIATNVWRVSVRVSWTGHAGISESLVVTRQENYRFPAGCANQ